jgi:hypothetical protein
VGFSAQQYVNDVAAARQKAQQALDKTEQYMRVAAENVRNDLQAKTEGKKDANAMLLEELQRAAAQRKLDKLNAADVAAGEIIRRGAALGDVMLLQVMRDDIKLMASDDRQDQVRVESLLAQLNAAETPLLSAMHQAARQIEQELATGLAQMTISFALARGEAAGTSSTLGNSNVASRIIDWAKGATLPVAFTTPDGGLNPPPTAYPGSTR